MADIQLQRETIYDQQMSVTGVTDGVSFKIVWCWRKHSRSHDWNLSKTVVKTAGEIQVELSEQQASEMPFVDGYVSIYKIDASTSKKTLYATYDVRVVEGTAGTDWTATSSLQTAVPWTYNYEGGAQVDTLKGYNTASNDGEITAIVCGCQEAPAGSSIIFDIYKNGVTTGTTITLASGDTRNTATASISLSQDDYVTVEVTQVGDIGSGIAPWITLQYQAS